MELKLEGFNVAFDKNFHKHILEMFISKGKGDDLPYQYVPLKDC